MSKNHSTLKEGIVERIKSMIFLCVYCNTQTATTPAIVDFNYHAAGSYAIAFFICPDCRNKFMVKIEDLGKVGN
jgi:hypothetical protein